MTKRQYAVKIKFKFEGRNIKMTKKILVESMTCSHSVNNVVDALKEIGLKDVEVKKLVTAEVSENINAEVIV